MDDFLRTLVASDLHVPYHDKRAFDLLLGAIDVWMPDQVIINGDGMDCNAVSQYDKDPSRIVDGGLQEEADMMRRLLRLVVSTLGRRTRIRTVDGKRRVIYKPGNHEDRIRRYLWRHPELYGLRALEIPELLGLDDLGITYEPDDTLLAQGALRVSHGTRVRQKAGYTATAELEAAMYGYGTVTGHTHRLATVHAKTPQGVVSASEGGCLCDLEPTYTRNPNWQHGVTLIYSSLTTTQYHVQSVPFKDGACVIEGKRVSV